MMYVYKSVNVEHIEMAASMLHLNASYDGNTGMRRVLLQVFAFG